MRKRLLAILPAALLAGLILLPIVSQSADDGGLATLRGAPIQTAREPEVGDALKKAIETTPIDRDFTQQPPLVSHAIDNYPITKEFNKCMDCHSWERAKAEKATKVSQSHFKDAQGNELNNLAARRYFCTQCHVPQIDAKPLVANTFQRATGAR